jgi:hypothetical protein
MPNLRYLHLSGNQLIALPASFGLPLIFNRLIGLDLRHNSLTQLPDNFGLGMDLPFTEEGQRLYLGNNSWNVSAAAAPACCSFAVMAAWTSTEPDEPAGECKKDEYTGDLETCDLADGRCPVGSSSNLADKTCAACEEDPSQVDGDLFILAVVPGPIVAYAVLACWTKWRVGKKVRQLAVSGADVEVRFGLCQAGAEPARALRADFIAHLACEGTKVQIEDFSTTLVAGARVVVHSEGEHSGAHGAVVKKAGEQGGATTSTAGAEVVYQVKLDDTGTKEAFTRMQLRARPHLVGAAADAPVAIYVVTAEWAARPEFLSEIVLSLAARAGMDLSSIRGDGTVQDCLLGRSHGHLAGLRAGVFLFVAGAFNEEAHAYKLLTNPAGLGLAAVASHGHQKPHMLAAVSAFLAKERRSEEFAEARGAFAEAAGGAHERVAELIEQEKAFDQAATRTAALFRISLPHVQMVSLTWSLSSSWPTGIQRLRDTVGAFVQLNALAVLNPACASSDDPSRGTKVGLMFIIAYVVLVVYTCIIALGHGLCCARVAVCCNARCCNPGLTWYGAMRCNAKLPPELKARELEMRLTTNARTVLTLYTLLFPMTIVHVTNFGDWRQTEDGEWFNRHIGMMPDGAGRDIDPFFGCSRRCVEEWIHFLRVIAVVTFLTLVVCVPLALFFFMHRAKRRGLLQTARTQARLGWLYEAYTEKFFYYELVSLLSRAAIIIVPILLDDRAVAALTSNAVILGCMLGLQLWLRPFAEDDEASSCLSVNTGAAFALACQVLNVGLAIVSEATGAGEDEDREDDLLSWAVVGGGLAVFLAPILLSLSGPPGAFKRP